MAQGGTVNLALTPDRSRDVPDIPDRDVTKRGFLGQAFSRGGVKHQEVAVAPSCRAERTGNFVAFVRPAADDGEGVSGCAEMTPPIGRPLDGRDLDGREARRVASEEGS